MTEFSGACDGFDVYGNTISVQSNDIGFNNYVFISGFENIKISTEDKFVDIISLMVDNMIPTIIAIAEKYRNILSDHYKFIENNEIE